MAKEVLKEVATDSGETEFQLRLKRVEGVGLATTRTGQHYFMLDSADYWYDVIQESYPRTKKCSCKSEWFTLQIRYYYREHCDDVEYIEVLSTCANCAKTSIALGVEIHYSPTDGLVNRPLVFCKNPQIKYKAKQLNGLWTDAEFLNTVQHCFQLGFFVYCWYFVKQENKRFFKSVSIEELADMGNFLRLYLSQKELTVSDVAQATDELGVYLKEDLWRTGELIELTSYNINGNEMYFVRYATQFIDKAGEVQDKSESFRAKTIQFEQYLKEHFINKRHKNCFDGEWGYAQFLKDRK
ncbi:MAG: hypothetical protein FWF41_08810 [Betaproteobacteria bacterium]|nr:hypothetical protein [Betaproteobacteria bacterium]